MKNYLLTVMSLHIRRTLSSQVGVTDVKYSDEIFLRVLS